MIKILWADDEIDLLKSQVMFLNAKGYEVIEVTNGRDAIEKVEEDTPDVVFLDENMPGISGLETLERIKEIKPSLPVVMITKSEEERIMEEAIGSKISDYLIKPVNPNQILLSLKKIIDHSRLIQEKTTSAYQQDFQKIFMAIQQITEFDEWVDIYRKLVGWELNLQTSGTKDMNQVIEMQKTEANSEFCKFVANNYLEWLAGSPDAPMMSHQIMDKKVMPEVRKGVPMFFILIDNLRFDQWKVIEPLIAESFKVEEETAFMSILPTATQYARNAIFAGMMPAEIEKNHPDLWKNDEDEGGKNLHESELIEAYLRRNNHNIKSSYVKISNHDEGQNLVDNIHNYLNNDLNVIVYNFVDMLSHARTEMAVVRELANDEAAYRSITLSWFRHSPLKAALDRIADKNIDIIVTTDHGTKQVKSPSKVLADRKTTTNLRYKTGKNLQYEKKDVLEIREPAKAGLPKQHVSSSFIFAKEDKYFVYPNNFTYYANFFRNTFQHGGISLEEMIVPFVRLRSKR